MYKSASSAFFLLLLAIQVYFAYGFRINLSDVNKATESSERAESELVKDSPTYKVIHQQNNFGQSRCEQYKGSVCENNLNGPRLVYLSPTEEQHEIESALKSNMKDVQRFISPGCLTTVRRVVCLHIFPPCRYVGYSPRMPKPLRICREECENLKSGPCAKEFKVLENFNFAEAVMTYDCSTLPLIDDPSNEICARVFSPGKRLNETACQERFLLGGSPENVSNTMKPIYSSAAVCENVRWRPLDKKITESLRHVVSNTSDISPVGRFAYSSAGEYCVQMPLPMSALITNKDEYSRMLAPYNLPKPSLNTVIPGFSVKIHRQEAKTLRFPIGHLSEYRLDKIVVIPNVTVYYNRDISGTNIYGQGFYDICGTKFTVKVEQTEPDQTVLSGKSRYPVDLSTIELAFGLRQPSNDLVNVIRKFNISTMRLTNPKLNIIWENQEERVMRFSGQSYYNGWGSLEINVEFLLGKNKSFWAAGITTSCRSFKDMFGILAGMEHVRLAKLLDRALDVSKVGFIFATEDVRVPEHHSLKFQHEPIRSMTNDDVPSGFLLESHGNIKESCSRNDNRTLICELAQFAVGIKATTRVRAKSNWKGLRLVLEFDPDGKTSPHSIASLAKLTTAWKKIDPFRRVPANKVEIEEKPESPSEKEQIKGRLLWVKKLEIDVKFARKGIPSDKVYISVNVILRNKRYIYRIKHLDLTYCLKVLNDISETVKVLKGV